MEMYDLGRKMNTGVEAAPSPRNKQKVSYPSFSIMGEQIPDELSDKPVGHTCRLEIIVKKVSDSESTYDNGEKRIELEIQKMGYSGSKKVKKEDYDEMSDEEKDKADEEEVLDDEE